MNILQISTGVLAAIIAGGIVLLLIIILVSWWIGTSNSIKKMKISIEESLSGIDVALTKRFDLLTEQLKVVKGYMKHEKEIMIQVTELRTNANRKDLESLQKMDNTIKNINREIDITHENYPQLKADKSFVLLQASVTDAEEHLQAARRLFNSNVSAYNKSIVVFPRSIVANHLHAEKHAFFVADQAKTGDVPLEF